jgi:hypothetical protein
VTGVLYTNIEERENNENKKQHFSKASWGISQHYLKATAHYSNKSVQNSEKTSINCAEGKQMRYLQCFDLFFLL